MSVQLGWFAEDFKLLSHLRQLITDRVTQALSAANHSELKQNEIFKIEDENSSCEWMRIILPHGLSTGHQLIDDKNSDKTPKSFYFVGFFGTKSLCKPESDNIACKVLDIDEKLVEELRQNPYIICYASAFRNYLTDAFNFVIFTSEKAIPLWRKSLNHDIAIGSLSQKYYAAVRIHMGHFTTSNVCDEYEVFRTTFLDFTAKDMCHRHVEQWKDDDEENTSKCTLKVIL